MIEILTVLLPLMIEFLPVILELFDKSAEQRAAAVPKFDAMFNRAVKEGSAIGMVAAQLAGCIARMDDKQFASFKSATATAVASMKAAAASKGGE